MSEEPRKARRYTPNQVVAYNLRRARQHQGWSQKETIERLAPHLGVTWSKASYSLAERSADRGDRVRNFTADDLVAFSLTFELPILWFFLPPASPPGEPEIRIAPPEASDAETHPPMLLVELIFGRPETQVLLAERLEELWGSGMGPIEGSFLKLLYDMSGLASRSAINKVVGEVEEWAQDLRDLAALLDAAGRSTADTMEASINALLDDYCEQHPTGQLAKQ